MPTPASRSLFNLIEIFTRGIYRIPISEGDDDSGGIIEGFGGGNPKKISTLISQRAVIRFLAEHIDTLSPGQANITLDELHLGHKTVFSINGNHSTRDALAKLDESKVGALAVVNDQEAFVETFSASNLRVSLPLLHHLVLLVLLLPFPLFPFIVPFYPPSLSNWLIRFF
jgi:CBS domain-containing protein